MTDILFTVHDDCDLEDTAFDRRKPVTLYLLTTGDGSDGDEWNLLGIYSTYERAAEARARYQQPRKRPDGSTYVYYANDVEEWALDPLEPGAQ